MKIECGNEHLPSPHVCTVCFFLYTFFINCAMKTILSGSRYEKADIKALYNSIIVIFSIKGN